MGGHVSSEQQQPKSIFEQSNTEKKKSEWVDTDLSKANNKSEWVDTDFSKDDSVKALDVPTGYDTVYKEPEVKSADNNLIIIILVIFLIVSSGSGIAFMFMQKK